ncbi:hypothetical protein DM02DRAFT_564152 [Periconia macrospinosa]|uniref:Transmembrane protein n=1 Tax=Periconia macrospinosa TaxID=97972 RepID=A0A2V1DNZ6_9PLEO|nr:hypothetical protein DM02DRAFT_564152 [Periconia macrospinosa]
MNGGRKLSVYIGTCVGEGGYRGWDMFERERESLHTFSFSFSFLIVFWGLGSLPSFLPTGITMWICIMRTHRYMCVGGWGYIQYLYVDIGWRF